MSERAEIFPARTFAARFDALSDALAFASKAGADAGCSADTCKRIELVIEELFTNTVDYGYANTQLPESERTVRLTAIAEPGGIRLLYEDSAAAFDPTDLGDLNIDQHVKDRQIGGIGRFLVARLPDSVTYQRSGDTNRIILRFDR